MDLKSQNAVQLYDTVVLSGGRDLSRLVGDLRNDHCNVADDEISRKVIAVEHEICLNRVYRCEGEIMHLSFQFNTALRANATVDLPQRWMIEIA